MIVANREPYIHERTPDGSIRVRPSGQRPGHGAGAGACGRARASGSRTAAARRIARRPTRNGRVRVPPGEESYRPAPGLADARGGARATTTASPTRGSGRSATSPTRVRSSAARTGSTTRRSTGGSPTRCARRRTRRSDRARAGLSLRAGAADDPRAAAPRDHHHLLAHPLAERRALRHLPVARRAAGGAARQQHPRLPHPAPLQQLPRLGRPLPRGAHRPRRARRGHQGRTHAGAPLSDLDRVADPLARRPCRQSPSAAPACSPSWGCAPDALLGVGVDRLDYTKGIEERLLAVERLLERFPALRGRFTFVQLGGAEPDPDRALPPAERQRRAGGGPHQRAVRQRHAIGRSSCCARTTSRPRSSATTAPRTSAT